MTLSLPARRGVTAFFAVLVAAVFVLLGLTAGAAQAELPGQPVIAGNASFTLGAGKGGSVLKKNKFKVKKVAPAKVSRKGKNFVAKLPVRNVTQSGRTDVTLNGGFVISKGKRGIRVRSLNVAIKNGKATIGGVVQQTGGKKSGAKATNIFKVSGKASVSTVGNKTTVKINKGKVSLAGGLAKTVRKHLRLKKAPSGQIASLNLNASRSQAVTPVDPCEADPNAEGCQPVDPCIADPNAEGCQPAIVDPYLAQCNVAATSSVVGNLPVATALPTLTGAKATVAPASINWGFKESFRSYVNFAAGGSLHALDGASTVGGPPLISAFSFPAENGQYAANDPVDTTDDQAIINGEGTALFCATGHEFRVAISNPTIVIDGDNSRIIADVDTNLTGVWTPTQRIDLADLDVDGITPFYNRNGSQVNWGEINASLTAAGADAVCGAVDAPACSYVEGTELDSLNLKVGTEFDVPAAVAVPATPTDPEKDAWNAFNTQIATDMAFPYSATVGCSPQIPAGATASAARSIDEHNGYAGTTYEWVADGARPAATPDLSAATAVSAGGLDWGVRTALRGSVNGTGEFNLSEGATASNTPFVGNGTGSLPYPQAGGTGQMSGAGKFFTWPASSTASFFDAGGAGLADDRLVLQGTGRVGFCNVMPIMSYGTVLSNPTVIIDGANSRITIDVATRFRNSWLRGRVDFASLDLTGITPTEVPGGGNVIKTWANIPATLTENGSRTVNVLSKATYVAGAALDPVTIRATVAE